MNKYIIDIINDTLEEVNAWNSSEQALELVLRWEY